MATKIDKRNGFLDGIARVIDLGGTYNPPKYIKTDYEAILNDWEVVGKDLRKAIIHYYKFEIPCQKKTK